MMNKLGTDQVAQIGIVVRDIEESRAEWAGVLGVAAPPIIQTSGFDQAQTHYRGIPSDATAKLCFFSVGQVQIELIQPDGRPSSWQSHLEENGPSVQHIAFVVPSMTEARQRMDADGFPTEQTGEYTGGRYAYLDTADRLGVHIELLENDPE